MRKDFSNNCRTLASNDTNFEVTLCQSQSHCGQGYFLVERIDKAQCADSMRTEVSWNSRVDSLVHTYDEFGALIESNHTAVRAPVHSQLLPQDFSIDVCSTFCKPFTSESVSLMDLPLCSRIMPQQGVYLRIDETNPTKREKYKQENMGFKYIWEPLGCRFDQRFEQFDNTTCLSARPYSVSLQGDSHLRALWYALDARLTGSTASSGSILRLDEHQHSRYLDATRLSNKLDVQDDGTTVAESSGSTNSLRVQYVSRAHLDNLVDSANHVFAYDEEWGGTLAEMEQDGNDAIVLASGHWLARGFWAGGHFTLERFEDMVEYAMGRLMLMDTRRNTARGKDPWHLVWFGE
ncbi:hypothetical protein HDU83_009209 [Entophlyctis luteolus]|nr:hypothetical protein HDU83_009209 [Entophlyctis luteolus]